MCGIPLASAPQATRRPAGSGWWGVIFGLGLLAVGGMVSLPTAAQSGEEIQVVYSAHRQIIIIQQLVGVVLLVPFLAFARTLDRRSLEWAAANAAWLMPAAIAAAAADLATVVVP